ncbi:MAG: cell envelope integrity protein CreD [Treponema sp.]|nr:cell envelope integrity protein CreD [Treponema sp.]
MKKNVLDTTLLKIGLVLILVLLFLIPISLIKNLISDRKYYHNDAVDSIMAPFGGVTYIQGLVIAVPYTAYSEHVDSKGEKQIEKSTEYIIFAPDKCEMDVSTNPYYLSRGIFKVPVFSGQVELNAEFSGFDFSYFGIEEKDVISDGAFLILGLSNTKSLTSQPKINMNGNTLSISPIKYDNVSPFSTSVYFNLAEKIPLDRTLNEKISLSGKIDFQGGKEIRIRPIAGDNTFKMVSEWKSPSFNGGWLPKERNVTDSGFSALWEIAGLSTAYPKSWHYKTKIEKGDSEYYGSGMETEYVSTLFLVPVDAYKKTERSVKYALLFLIIPFIALLISEIFSKRRIHPVQYCLIGLADVIFYLLLLSISEHVSFDLTYLICSLAVGLATLFYASSIFRSIKFGGMLSGVQVVSYIFLYGTLQAEDYALLIGSIGLFIVILLLMFITRKIDWYNLGGLVDFAENTENPANATFPATATASEPAESAPNGENAKSTTDIPSSGAKNANFFSDGKTLEIVENPPNEEK